MSGQLLMVQLTYCCFKFMPFSSAPLALLKLVSALLKSSHYNTQTGIKRHVPQAIRTKIMLGDALL